MQLPYSMRYRNCYGNVITTIHLVAGGGGADRHFTPILGEGEFIHAAIFHLDAMNLSLIVGFHQK